SRGDSSESTEASQATPSPAATTPVAAQTTDDPLAVDPAKQEPLLDKFTSKDPFLPLATSNSSSSSSGGSSGGGGGGNQTALSAKITMNGTEYAVTQGDSLPSTNAIFTVSAVASSSVTFALVSGTFENGDSSVVVGVGESVKVTKQGGPSYTLKVISVGDSGGGGTQDGHSITVLSITDNNGTALVTLEIDGKTYSDKKVGDTFSTSWGEVKIIAINVDAQTVTVMHGDQTITLRAGQVIVK
ncbi:MAG TPA: hypothetical protein VFH61_07430, partial [Thermoleophilia bacterium]|nr:hypothetical protein [Thermoleophilia bacterium]